MSARTRAPVHTKQPADSSSLYDDGVGEEARLKPARPWRWLEIDARRLRGHAAASPSDKIPPLEGLALQ
jgi:hypothetical protein